MLTLPSGGGQQCEPDPSMGIRSLAGRWVVDGRNLSRFPKTDLCVSGSSSQEGVALSGSETNKSW